MTRELGAIDPTVALSWGNHTRRHFALLERHLPALLERAESLASGTITLAAFPTDAHTEMSRLRASSATREEALRLVGTYYAYHFVHMNQRRIRVLEETLRSGVKAPEAYRQLMGTLQAHSHALAVGILSELVAIEGAAQEEFVLCNVGAIWDHEDLDVWAIADRPEAVPRLSILCGRVARESLRWAQRVQFYLSEYLPRNSFAGTLDEYRAVLDGDLRNFVVVTQVLQATRLAGAEPLYRSLARELRDRYLASEPPSPYHEGFLRGALSEVQSLAHLPERVGLIDPKAEIYRLIRILLGCEAAKLGIAVASPWDVLDQAASADSLRAVDYEALGRAFDFAEVLRYLFGLFYAQEVPVHLDDPRAHAALERVAAVMGYGREDGDSARALLRDYHAHRSAVRAVAHTLAQDLFRHVQGLSVFYRMLHRHTRAAPFDALGGNLARILLRYVETHRQRVFWEDIVEMCKEKPEVLSRWVQDLARLRGRQLRWTVGRYARLMQEDVAHFYEFLLLLESGPLTHSALADMLVDEAIALYAEDEELLSRFADLFHAFPELVARFVEREEPAVTARFISLFRARWDGRRYRKAGIRLLSLLSLYHFSSHYSKRHSAPVLARYPAAITYLDDFDELARLASTAMAEAKEQHAPATRKQRLGDFYDLEFCRLSLMTLSGVDPRKVGVEFRRSSERYVAALFDCCTEEVAQLLRREAPSDRAGFALFATGGSAREDPYDVDYDMFALLTSPEPSTRRFYNRVLARFTRALTERGIVPHNRLTDRFGAYVASPEELVAFFQRGVPDAFIEKTELLSSRRVAGDSTVDAVLTETVVEPFVFRDPSYPFELVEELRLRRAHRYGDEMEIKETPGGLRDIQLLLSILKARLRLREPDGTGLFGHLRVALPELAATLSELEETVAFLKQMRDVYRLTVVCEDRLDPRYFGIIALFMGYGGGASRDLLADYRAALTRTQRAVQECLEALGLPTAGF
jgi:hypothetical protein